MIDPDDTIVAIASPTSPAIRGVVRLSGNQTVPILERLGINCSSIESASRFDVSLDLGQPLGAIQISVMLWPTARSYTGQPSAELHTFGSLPILRSVVDVAILAGGRAARPGEFTMRAFLAGRLDLTQAEAVLGVIEAEGTGSLDHALRQLAGNLARPLNEMRSSLLDLLADVEAGLDFVDEDISFISDEDLILRLTELDKKLDQTSSLIRSRGGGSARPIIALRGEPNAGKSSLLNRLAGNDVAIVADIAGTTRDTVSVEVELEGHTVLLVDTAGIENSTSSIETQSQHQANRVSDEASVRLWCVDISSGDAVKLFERMRRVPKSIENRSAIDLWVATKSDLEATKADGVVRSHPSDAVGDLILCSAKTGEGIDSLRRRIIEGITLRDAEEVGSVIGTAARCGQSIDQACEAISSAIQLTRNGEGHEFVASELRLCATHLGEVTGEVYTDDILDLIFGRFCIGK